MQLITWNWELIVQLLYSGNILSLRLGLTLTVNVKSNILMSVFLFGETFTVVFKLIFF